MKTKIERHIQRKRRIGAKLFGTAKRPRLTVTKSNLHVYAQVIDDEKGNTLASFTDIEVKKTGKMTKTEMATAVGEGVAKKAISKKIKKVVFDRNGFIYHGRVKALADGARKGGLEF